MSPLKDCAESHKIEIEATHGESFLRMAIECFEIEAYKGIQANALFA